MNFIKKNIILFSVLLVALIVSGVFIYLVIIQTNQMNKANEQVTSLKEKINTLNKQSPIPSLDNSKKINADAEVIEKKTKKIQQIFGRPYKDAVEIFLNELGTPREDFFPLWKKTYEQEAEKNSPRGLIFNRFFANFDNEKRIKAINAFFAAVKKTSLEPLNEANIDGCLMEALGLPRKMEPIPCKKYMMDMQDNLITYMKSQPCKSCGELITEEDFFAEKCSKCGGDPGKPDLFVLGDGKKGNAVEKITFEKQFDGASLPRPDEVSYIFKHLKLIEDLFLRLKNSGIKNLKSISKNDLKGVTVSDYMIFTYDIQVSGSLQSIRNFLNDLMEAYKQNRIYIIRRVSLEAKEDAKSIVSQSDVKLGTPKKAKDLKKNPAETEKNEADEAGIPIIGNDDTVIATIKFDYVIYIGDELTEND